MIPRHPERPIPSLNYIGGAFRAPSAGAMAPVYAPHTGKHVGEVAMSTAADVDAAVRAAQLAAPGWAATPIKERSVVLFRMRELMLGEIEALAHAAALESGKTVGEAHAEVMKGIEVLEFALSLQNLDAGDALEVSRGVTCTTRRVPLGVVAGIVPFNFPVMVPMWMFPIAIAAGNAFVLKPSERVPTASTMIAELWKRAGLPDGVFSIVNGDAAVVDALIDHPGIEAVAFVGSTPVAKRVYQRATGHGKRALALGGAKNHIILAPDADPAIAAQGIADSFTGCAGQRCMAASLLVAVGDCEHLIEAVVARARAIVLGRDMGAIINQASLQRLQAAIADAAANGAKLRLDGRGVAPSPELAQGYWLGPTVIDGIEPKARVATEELFGPVLSIVRVPNLEAALALEKQNPYGNATSVFTQSGAVAQRVAEASTSGMIGVNIGVPVPREPFSFGGTKQSRFGHGDITGLAGLDFWTSIKKITSKWNLQSDASWMS